MTPLREQANPTCLYQETIPGGTAFYVCEDANSIPLTFLFCALVFLKVAQEEVLSRITVLIGLVVIALIVISISIHRVLWMYVIKRHAFVSVCINDEYIKIYTAYPTRVKSMMSKPRRLVHQLMRRCKWKLMMEQKDEPPHVIIEVPVRCFFIKRWIPIKCGLCESNLSALGALLSSKWPEGSGNHAATMAIFHSRVGKGEAQRVEETLRRRLKEHGFDSKEIADFALPAEWPQVNRAFILKRDMATGKVGLTSVPPTALYFEGEIYIVDGVMFLIDKDVALEWRRS